MADFYKILGVDKTSSPEEIKKAYRKLAHQYHPDKNPGNKEAEAKFKEINNAYETLGDAQKKANYDRFGSNGASGFGGFNPNNNAYSSYGQQGDFSFSQDFAGFENLSDIFDSFFGSSGGSAGGFSTPRGRTGGSRQRGVDLEVEMNITLEEAAKGVEKTFKHKHNISCKACEGKGFEKGSKVSNCGTCKGSGRVYQRMQTFFGIVQQEITCPTCQGLGKIYEKQCKVCTGKGFNQEVEEIKVKIPAGVQTSNRVRISGKGEAGYRGSENGDLYISINILPHKLFRREGLDVTSSVEINYLDILLGTKLEVETVWGKVDITVPPLTDPQGKLRLKNQGMPKLNNESTKGDHYLDIKVKMPKELGSKQKETLEKIREELQGGN